MMTDLSEEQFQRMVAALHSHFTGGEFDAAAYPDRGRGAPELAAQRAQPMFGREPVQVPARRAS
jgi:hypothetical protein